MPPYLDFPLIAALQLVACAGAVVLAVTWRIRSRKPYNLPYPPGPKPRIFTDNLFDVPLVKPWFTYTDWGKIYGDSSSVVNCIILIVNLGPIIHLRCFGEHNIILNNMSTAVELLDKRSGIYSDRSATTMIDL